MAVLLLLAVALLTAYFRESDSGVAHSVQGGVLTVVSPLQSGTATATKPFRDAWNWVGDLFSAKSENKALKREVQDLRAGLAEELTTQAENDQLRALLDFQEDHVFPKDVQLVTARVVARSTSAWYSTATINAGSSDGVDVYDPVVNGQGLVGRVTKVNANAAQVLLVTDQQSFVDAMVEPGRRAGHHQRQRHRRRHARVRGQEREGQGGSVRRDVGQKRIGVRARHPHRPGGERRPAGRGAVPVHRHQAVRRLPQAGHRPGDHAMSVIRPVAEKTERAWPAWGEVARLAVVLLLAVLLQTAVAPHLRLLGAYPDFALIAVVCVALVKGSETGAVFGFLTGMLTAIALMEPFGLSAFVFVLVGYFAGRYAETADLPAGLAPLLTVFAATLVANVLFAMAQFLLAREVPLGFFLGRVLFPSLVFNTLLAAPVYLLVRVWLRGAGDLRAAART